MFITPASWRKCQRILETFGTFYILLSDGHPTFKEHHKKLSIVDAAKIPKPFMILDVKGSSDDDS